MLGRVVMVMCLVLLLMGCSKDPVCDAPYIRHANACCLDTNANKICDSDERVVTDNVTAPAVLSNNEVYSKLNDHVVFINTICTYNISYQEFSIKHSRHRYFGLLVEVVPAEYVANQSSSGVVWKPTMIERDYSINMTGTGFYHEGKIYTNAHVVTCDPVLHDYWENILGLNYTNISRWILAENAGFDDKLTESDIWSHIDNIIDDHMSKSINDTFKSRTIEVYTAQDGYVTPLVATLDTNGTAWPGEDYAIIHVDAQTTKSIPFSNVSNLSIGSEVFVLGFPYVTAKQSRGATGAITDSAIITKGIVGGKKLSEQNITYYNIDAAATYGSSGSPVLDVYGHVVGILTYGSTEGDSVNFILPIVAVSDDIVS